MNTVIKSTFRNIRAKLGRSIILILCVMITSFVAIFAVSGRATIENIVTGVFSAMTGSIDLTVDVSDYSSFDGCPEADICGFTLTGTRISRRDPENYYLSYSDKVSIYNFSDYHTLYEMGQIGTDIQISGNEAYVTENYADKYNVKIGDTITLYGARSSVSADVVVTGIASIPATAPIMARCVLVTPETICTLTERTEPNYVFYYVDVKDDEQIDEFEEQVLANDFRAEVDRLDDETLDGIESVTRIFLFLFLFTFLLVIFVTINFSEKIVNERMSFVGTLRSIGVSRRKTSFILILENAIYGLIGSILGCLLHVYGLPPLINKIAVFDVADGYGTINAMDYYQSTALWVYIVVVIGAILVECLCPLFTLLKAVKTPIRDIIFQNKDTKFKYSWSRLYAGVVIILIAVIASFLRKSFVALCLCLSLTVVALAVLTPFVLKGISMLGERFLSSSKTPLLNLAIKEVSNNRHMVATAVLCVTTIILSTCLNTFAVSFLNDLTDLKDDYDVIIGSTDMRDQYYSFIEDVDGVVGVDRFLRTGLYMCNVGSAEGEFEILCDTDIDSCYSRSELTGEMDFHEIAITSKLANEQGLNVGDTVNVVLGNDFYFPCEFEATVAIIMNNQGYSKNVIAVSEGIYNQLVTSDDKLGMIYVHCEEGMEYQVRDTLAKYLTDTEGAIKVRQEVVNEIMNSNRKTSAVIYGIIAMGVALTLIGTSGNQIIAFEGRRREIAVLYSTAMSKKQLRKLLALETALSVGIGSLISLILGGFISKIFGDALYMITDGDMPPIVYSFGAQFTYVLIIFIVLMLTVIAPYRRLKKMNCAQELKYE